VIKALMIDVDGVIVNGRPADGRPWGSGLAADLGLTFSSLQSAFFQPYWEQIVTGRIDLRDCLKGVLSEVAPNITSDALLTYWFQNDARLDEGLLTELAELRSEKLQVHLATNQEHERAYHLMNTLGLGKYIDGCHYSAAIGYRKPAPEFYHIVARRVGLPPDELLLIDDTEENVQAAITAGWQAIRWTPEQTLRGVLTSAAVETSQVASKGYSPP
jgi:putative hydrolase of the HAD superfamily